MPQKFGGQEPQAEAGDIGEPVEPIRVSFEQRLGQFVQRAERKSSRSTRDCHREARRVPAFRKGFNGTVDGGRAWNRSTIYGPS